MTLEFLQLFADPVPRDGPGQMAIDEALLGAIERPVLRLYQWREPWVSFGYSQSSHEVLTQHPDRPLVRRWTGGGIVDHARDWTFSLIVPRDDAFAQVRPATSYCQIHKAVGAALQDSGLTVRLAGEVSSSIPGACFAGKPAQHDILDGEGAKICGGAQRRTRTGMLHQGSLQGAKVPDGFGEELVARLAGKSAVFTVPRDLEAQALSLVESKYSSRAWTFRLP